MDKRKVILDCDTGSDDAVAIMLAVLSEKIDLLGITTVAGNKKLEFTTFNTLAVLDALKDKTPVYMGCTEPIAARLLPNRHGTYDGMTGLSAGVTNSKGELIVYHTDKLPLPDPTSKPQEKNGIFWMIETLMASDGDITLVPTGPLTNIAIAMRVEPRICEKIKEIVFMGG
ncbi:MAG: nucleoside hydrolase, partial [Lachnospiraceae bacterium]|nr:nucleoside hydrolase [Lachnospiraceae bacterium]